MRSAVLSLLLAACSAETTADAGPAPDARADAPSDDARADAPRDDAGLDASRDAGVDAQPDLSYLDAAPSVRACPAPALPDPASVASLDAFLDAYAAYRCARALRCYGRGSVFAEHEDLEYCHPRWRELHESFLVSDASRDVSTYAPCLRSLGIADCVAFDPRECDAALRVGSLPSGAGCTADVQCASERCIEVGGCARCDDGGVAGAPCAEAGDCAHGLRCMETASPTGACGPGGGPGDPCTGDQTCSDREWCDAAGLCVSDGGRLGDPCEPGGVSNTCADDLVCAGLTCAAPVGDGAACDDLHGCGPGSACGASGVCVGVAGPGCPCGSDAVCPVPFACVGGTCVGIPVAGEPCDSVCGGSVCVSGTCTRLADLAFCDGAGVPAHLGNPCTGMCDAMQSRCAAPALSGASCTFDEDCAAGACRFRTGSTGPLYAVCTPGC